jgi:citrate synthase
MNENSYQLWDERRGKIQSKKGGWVIGKGVFNHGYSMMDDLVGEVSYMQVVVLNATGRLPERAVADWIDAIHICLSWPDPRIWCNQIGALGGAMRASVVASTTAGVLAADAKSYGIKPLIQGVYFIQAALLDSKRGLSVGEIIRNECAKHRGKPNIMGYARPLAKGDERIVAMRRVQQKHGLPSGEHLQLADQIEQSLLKDFDESMNINGYMSAFLSDLGYTSEEVYRIFAVLVTSGVTACYVDARDKAADTFLPLRCADIEYTGTLARPVPCNDMLSGRESQQNSLK